MEKKSFGQIYLDGQLMTSSWAEYEENKMIHFGDSVSGEEHLEWIRYRGGWVSTKVVLLNITMNELSKFDYLFGRPVRIDGVPYECRCPKLTHSADGKTEWMDILHTVGQDNSIWDWEISGFWGQGIDEEGLPFVILPRVSNPTYQVSRPCDWRSLQVGFRPILMPMKPEPLVNDRLLGTELVVFHGLTAISGKLVGFSAYDLILSLEECLLNPDIYGDFIKDQHDGTIAVDRSAIDYLQKEPKKNERD